MYSIFINCIITLNLRGSRSHQRPIYFIPSAESRTSSHPGPPTAADILAMRDATSS